MDLAKIIAELRVELQCLDAAIASIEELARVQNVADGGIQPEPPSEPEPESPTPAPPEPGPGGVAPVKRRRGRPRKNVASDTTASPQPIGPRSTQLNDDPTASAA